MNKNIDFQLERDCLYSNFKEVYSKDSRYTALLKLAGFIPENRTLIDEKSLNDMKIMSLPVKKISTTDNLAIIVTTGSFSPIHEGHINAMNLAKKHVEGLGYNVIQGVISLSHDNYVSYKNNGAAKKDISIRTNIVYEKIKDIDWLTVDRFEGELVSCEINFSTVIERVHNYISYHLKMDKKNIKVFYVFGSDNANFSYAFVNNLYYNSICVDRDSKDYTDIQKELSSYENIHFITSTDEYKSISSTKKRLETINELITENADKNNIYLIRTDGVSDSLSIKLKELVEKYVNSNVSVRLFSSKDIDFKIENSISLDKYIKGNYNLDLSRVFELCSYQNKPFNMCSLKENVDQAINKIPVGDYTLVDDDSVSGYTMNTVADLLKAKGINIIDKVALVKNLIKDDETLYDVIDARDFLFNADNGGLVIDFLDEKNLRVPYIFPFVNLSTRANIKPEYQIDFSKEIIDYNLAINSDSEVSSEITSALSYGCDRELLKNYSVYLNNYLESR